MRFILPVPPSANRIWRVTKTGRTYKAPEYVSWLKTAGWEVHLQRSRKEPITGPVSLTITLPKGTRGDVDNRVKPVGDLLEACGIVANDRQISTSTITRGTGEHCVVELKELAA